MKTPFVKRARTQSDPYPPYWSLKRLPPGAEYAVAPAVGKAMVYYLPYLETPYDVTAMSMSGSVEVCFASLEEARAFFDETKRSGHVEKAELRVEAEGHARGRLVEEYGEEV